MRSVKKAHCVIKEGGKGGGRGEGGGEVSTSEGEAKGRQLRVDARALLLVVG